MIKKVLRKIKLIFNKEYYDIAEICGRFEIDNEGQCIYHTPQPPINVYNHKGKKIRRLQ